MARKFDRIDGNPHSKEFFFQGGKTGVLLIHGFTGTPGTMKKIGEALAEDGYTVSGILLPGHGTHISDMEKSTGTQWLSAARRGYTDLEQKCEKVIICGLSMGGLLTLILAAEYKPAGAIPIAAAVDITNKAARITPFLKFFRRYKGSGVLDPEAHPYEVNYAVTPIRKVPDLLRIQKSAKKKLKDITCPLLIVQGEQDRTVPKHSAEIIFSGAENSSDKSILFLKNSRHLCTVQPEFDVLIENIRKFIKKHT